MIDFSVFKKSLEWVVRGERRAGDGGEQETITVVGRRGEML